MGLGVQVRSIRCGDPWIEPQQSGGWARHAGLVASRTRGAHAPFHLASGHPHRTASADSARLQGGPGGLVTVDRILVEPALASVWAGREEYERDGIRRSVVSREGLHAMKRLAGRPQDLADIEALERGS